MGAKCQEFPFQLGDGIIQTTMATAAAPAGAPGPINTTNKTVKFTYFENGEEKEMGEYYKTSFINLFTFYFLQVKKSILYSINGTVNHDHLFKQSFVLKA